MYLNVIELAASFGVAESVVEGWVRNEGLPCVPDRGRLLFDRAQVVAWSAQRGHVAKTGFLAAEGPRQNAGRRLATLLRAGGIWRAVSPTELVGVLGQVVSRLPGATPAIRQLLAQRLGAPQGINWAPVGGGLALPHLRSPVALGPQSGILALLLLREPWGLAELVPDEVPVTRLLFFIAPTPRAHLELLGQLSGALTRGNLRPLVLAGAPDEELFAALNVLEDGAGKEPMP
jgi:PTS system nitrogen regulatory IIA component